MKRALPYRSVPIAFLHEVLSCDSEKGALTWKRRPRSHFSADWTHKRWNKKHAGKHAGWRNQANYLSIDVGPFEGKPMELYVSRVIWAMTTGQWPTLSIDHINRNPRDNRFVNLREATDAIQLANRTLKKTKFKKHIYPPR